MRRCLLALVLVVSCARTDKLADIPVQTATIDHFGMVNMEVMGGGGVGWAQLHIVEPGGKKDEIPLQLEQGAVGPMMSMAMGSANTGTAQLDLSHVVDPHGDDLLGGYSGWYTDDALLVGGEYHELENDRRVRFKLGGFEVEMGLSMVIAQEWLNVDVAPPDAGPVDGGPLDGGSP